MSNSFGLIISRLLNTTLSVKDFINDCKEKGILTKAYTKNVKEIKNKIAKKDKNCSEEKYNEIEDEELMVDVNDDSGNILNLLFRFLYPLLCVYCLIEI